jgi:hypothetical protein
MDVWMDTWGKDVINVCLVYLKLYMKLTKSLFPCWWWFHLILFHSLACKIGWFGSNCSEKCSANCIEQECDKRHGKCTFGCYPGWIGINCTTGKQFTNAIVDPLKWTVDIESHTRWCVRSNDLVQCICSECTFLTSKNTYIIIGL